jgi:hypothetical protein
MFFSGLNQGGVSKKEIIKYEIGDHHTEIKKPAHSAQKPLLLQLLLFWPSP